jgi:hypothetical protein
MKETELSQSFLEIARFPPVVSSTTVGRDEAAIREYIKSQEKEIRGWSN